jgi:hypothetical protein
LSAYVNNFKHNLQLISPLITKETKKENKKKISIRNHNLNILAILEENIGNEKKNKKKKTEKRIK